MKVNKRHFNFAGKLIQNSYRGKHGEVEPVFSHTEIIDVGHVQCELGYYQDEIWIFAPGSNEDEDWKFNWKYKLKKIYGKQTNKKTIPYHDVNPKIKVHTGFYESYLLLRSKLLSKAKSYNKIYCVFHSFSSGWGKIAAIDIQYQTGISPAVFACGDPSSGNGAFRDSYNKRVPQSYRITKEGDMVADSPLWIQGYRKIDHEITVGRNPFLFIYPFRALAFAINKKHRYEMHEPQTYKKLMPEAYEKAKKKGLCN